MDGLPLDHVAIAVHDLDRAAATYEHLAGSLRSTTETLASQGVRVCFVGRIELIEPTAPDTPVGRFLARRGPGLHHVAYRTTDLARELDRLREAGYRLVDPVPRRGARGHVVAFLHPESTGGTLIELVEASSQAGA